MADAGSRETTAPRELDARRLARRAATAAAAIAVLVLVVVLAPGLDEVRDKLGSARVGWVALAVVFEALSAASYVLMFRPVFCPRMGRRRAATIALAEVGTGSLVPASGLGGLALGAWVLVHDEGMRPGIVARRSVAFFLVKSSVNFVAVAVLGLALAVGLLGPSLSLGLTLVPALMSVATIALVLALPRLGAGREPGPGAGRVVRFVHAARGAIIGGVREAAEIAVARDPVVFVGAWGYWLWDNAVLWAAFHAFGAAPPLTVVLMGYLIGQLGGLLPLPGGVGGIDGGLIGAFIVFGAPAAATAAAVLLYRVILFWLPLLLGVPAFAALVRHHNRRASAGARARA